MAFLPAPIRLVEWVEPAPMSAPTLTRMSAPVCELLPGEARALGAVADKRYREFRDGRHCARLALAALGVPPAPILIGSQREPLWPAGIVGSITHCDRYRAAAVSRSTSYRSIGIDAEPDQALPDGLHTLVMRPEEQAALDARDSTVPHWDRLVFCAKESFYKAWFPVTRRWLDFTDVAVTIEPGRARFHVDLRAPSTSAERAFVRSAQGRYKVTGSHVVAFCGVEAELDAAQDSETEGL